MDGLAYDVYIVMAVIQFGGGWMFDLAPYMNFIEW